MDGGGSDEAAGRLDRRTVRYAMGESGSNLVRRGGWHCGWEAGACIITWVDTSYGRGGGEGAARVAGVVARETAGEIWRGITLFVSRGEFRLFLRGVCACAGGIGLWMAARSACDVPTAAAAQQSCSDSLESLYAPSSDAWSSSDWDTCHSDSVSDSASDSSNDRPASFRAQRQPTSSQPRPRHLAQHHLSTARPPSLRALGLSLYPPVPSPRYAARHGNHPRRFAFLQAFGEHSPTMPPTTPVQDADTVSAVQFNHDSDMLAAGDKGGRIIILKRTQAENPPRGWSAAISMPRRLPSRRRRPGRLVTPDTCDPPPFDPNKPLPLGAIAPNQMTAKGVPTAGYEKADFRFSHPWEPPKYRFWSQMQSHEPEFDYLKSMEVEERINQIRWCKHPSASHHLLVTNDKTIKLWRIHEVNPKKIITMDPHSLLKETHGQRQIAVAYAHTPSSPQSPQSVALHKVVGPAAPIIPHRNNNTDYFLQMPKLRDVQPDVIVSARKMYTNAHSYHINSISLNSDDQTFLSSDDLRVNVWSLCAGGRGFNVLDIKPGKMEDLTEVITSTEFHPQACNLFMHSTSRGSIKLYDMRDSAICSSWARIFQQPQATSSRSSFFSEIIASISDAKFSPCGRYILTRDYMTLRLWDMNMETRPVLVVPVHEQLRARLCDLYENDCIFDKFQCAFSNDGGSMLTGSYNSLFQAYSSFDGVGAAVEASVQYVSGLSGRHKYSAELLSERLIARSSAEELVHPARRVMNLHASPNGPFSAVAAGPALYVYYGAP